MRQRRIKNLEEKLAECSSYITENPKAVKGRWHEVFGNDNPIYLELGCGKGQFISENARRNPACNYIAVEGALSVVLRALEKAKEAELENITFVLEYVQDLRDFFEDGELAGIFLNFSDPWPKERHAKRRLTYCKRLLHYCQVLEKGGSIRFKTDNEGLFAFTLEQIEEAGLEIIEMSRDLHNVQLNPELAEGNITTEYEDKFAGIGKNINYVKFRAK
ncbi:MAG: tRNA (guanosine(46)-N7)-methyltransferase TrmB [Emergencia sp.]